MFQIYLRKRANQYFESVFHILSTSAISGSIFQNLN